MMQPKNRLQRVGFFLCANQRLHLVTQITEDPHHPSYICKKKRKMSNAMTWSLRSLILLSILWVTPSCTWNEQTDNHLLTPKEVVSKRDNTPNLLILDVRTPEEFAAGHIEGAQLVNWNDPGFEQRIAALDKSQPTLVYCAVGGRSGKAYSKLKQLGFLQVFDMKGGFDAWKKDQLPIAK